MKTQKRWVLLKHIDAPEDTKNVHFDLLLEDDSACRTWRLDQIPIKNGQPVKAIPAPLHRLEWLEKSESAVSGGRGWAVRVEGGFFKGIFPASNDYPINVDLYSKSIYGQLQIANGFCTICSGKSINYKSP